LRKISLPVYEASRCRLYALGRNAMYAACKAFGLKEGEEILTPAFDCDGSLQPFRALGLKLKFYRSDPYTFEADTGDMEARMGPSTKMVHVINHFGMPQPWDRIKRICVASKVPVMEDCAYSLFSKGFGTNGDAAIFSLRKNLPIVDGGMLRMNNGNYALGRQAERAPLFYRTESANVLTLVKSAMGYYKAPEGLRRMLRKANPAVEPPPPLYSEKEKGYPEWPLRDHTGEEFSCDYERPISALARFQLEGLPEGYYKNAAEMKRRYYSELAGKFAGLNGLRVLWPELPEGIVPFCLSVLVHRDRDSIFAELRKRYDVMAWPTLSQEVIDRLDEYPEVEILGRKVLQFNLPADKVMRRDYPLYIGRLARDLTALTER